MNPYILVVDDVAMVREMFCETLRKKGYDCVAVGTVFEALVHATKQAPQLVFVDYWLEDGPTSVTLVRTLRSLPGGDKMPIIGISGLEKEAEAAFKAVGVNGFLRKPLRDEPIYDVIALFLSGFAATT